ncbi:MAG: J domain-containing protein [Dongiaceae bacterium]
MNAASPEDPYKTLGVERNATAEEIRAAYRKLAKQFHPDLNPGKPEAEARFKTVSAAYALLSDPAQRARFDRGEIDASGAERAARETEDAAAGFGSAEGRRYYRDFGDQAARGKYRPETPFDEDFLRDLFGDAAGARSGGGFGAHDFHMPGQDSRYHLAVDFLDAANGATRRLTLPDGRVLDVTIPPGLTSGQVLRLKGQGMPGIGEGPPGDALIEIEVMTHPQYRREGNDVILELPVTLKEAVLGAKVEAPTIKGPVSLTVPPHSSSGTRLRLKGRGIAGGHQYVVLRVVLPAGSEPELEEFLKNWTPRETVDPRRDTGDR